MRIHKLKCRILGFKISKARGISQEPINTSYFQFNQIMSRNLFREFKAIQYLFTSGEVAIITINCYFKSFLFFSVHYNENNNRLHLIHVIISFTDYDNNYRGYF